jgi:hypothetical protein
MKKSLFTTLLCLLAFSFSVSAQTIRRVNNNAGVTGVNVYTTIQAAHDAAVAGDIVYVEPSTTSYGNLTATKRLTIYGNGFFISENTNTTLDSRSSNIGTLTLDAGTANSIISGLSIGGTVYLKDANITLTRCRLYYINLQYSGNTNLNPPTIADNIVISNCFIEANSAGDLIIGSFISFTAPTPNRYVSNAVIKNNIFNNGGPGVLSGVQNSLIMNNTVRGNWHANSGSTSGCNYVNNVCQGGNSTILSNTNGNSFSNNISLGSTFWPAGNGNQNNVSTTNFFIGSFPGSVSPDNSYQLSATSIGLTAGLNGGQVGAFGGSTPYSLGAYSAVPMITNFTTSGVGNSSTPLSVSITVRGNN